MEGQVDLFEMLGSVSLFNGISTFLVYLMKRYLCKETVVAL